MTEHNAAAPDGLKVTVDPAAAEPASIRPSRIRAVMAWAAERARTAAAQQAADQAARVTTAENRTRRADWGQALQNLGELLSKIGAHLTSSAYTDAEAAVTQAHDAGYEQRRSDEAEAREVATRLAAVPDVAGQDQAAEDAGELAGQEAHDAT